MAGNHGRMPASLSDALTGDGSLPLDDVAKEYWLKDLQNLEKKFLGSKKINYNIYYKFNYGKRPDHAGSDPSDGVIISLKLFPVRSITLILGGEILFFFCLY